MAALRARAEARGLSSAQLALAWLLNKHPHVLPISGTRRISHLESNVGAVGVQLSADEIAALDRLFDPQSVTGARYPDAGFVGIESR